MKISAIFVLFTFSVVVKGWAAILQPVLMSIGAALTALNIDSDLISDMQHFVWKSEASETTDPAKAREGAIKDLTKVE